MDERESKQRLARQIYATGSEEVYQVQPEQKLTYYVLTNIPEVTPSDDSTLGIEVLVLGRATSVSEHQQGDT